MPSLFALAAVLSLSRITLENNGKIRPQPDRENAFARASGGEDGIRTHDTLLRYTPLAGERLRPLGHLSVTAALDKATGDIKSFMASVRHFPPVGTAGARLSSVRPMPAWRRRRRLVSPAQIA